MLVYLEAEHGDGWGIGMGFLAWEWDSLPGAETNLRGVMVKENAGGDLTTGQCCPSTLGLW